MADGNYKAFLEGITRARLIRKDLENHPTEYYPEKVRGLNKAYLGTVKEIIRKGEDCLDEDIDFDKGMEIATIIENYRAFLLTIERLSDK